MKNIRKVIAIFCLLILYAYFINIYNFPSKIILHNSSQIDYKLSPLLNLNGDVLVSSTNDYKNYELSLSFGDITLKKVNVTVSEDIEVVPVRKNGRIKIIHRRCNDSWFF